MPLTTRQLLEGVMGTTRELLAGLESDGRIRSEGVGMAQVSVPGQSVQANDPLDDEVWELVDSDDC